MPGLCAFSEWKRHHQAPNLIWMLGPGCLHLRQEWATQRQKKKTHTDLVLPSYLLPFWNKADSNTSPCASFHALCLRCRIMWLEDLERWDKSMRKQSASLWMIRCSARVKKKKTGSVLIFSFPLVLSTVSANFRSAYAFDPKCEQLGKEGLGW